MEAHRRTRTHAQTQTHTHTQTQTHTHTHTHTHTEETHANALERVNISADLEAVWSKLQLSCCITEINQNVLLARNCFHGDGPGWTLYDVVKQPGAAEPNLQSPATCTTIVLPCCLQTHTHVHTRTHAHTHTRTHTHTHMHTYTCTHTRTCNLTSSRLNLDESV